MAGYAEGAAASRPSPGVAGRVYRSTDLPGEVALDTGAAWSSIGVGVVTSLPANPYDGQTVDVQGPTGLDGSNDPARPPVFWRFRYWAGSPTARKWKFVGGPPIFDSGGSLENVAGGT